MPRDTQIRQQLEERLAKLVQRTGRIEADLRRPGDRDWNERATERENEEVLQRLGESERGEIVAIRGALARLDAGSYGRCLHCASPIPAARLEALPSTATCADCAER